MTINNSESIYISVDNTIELHVKLYQSEHARANIIMIHGSIENGRIFYSKSDKGLAPFLSQHGLNAFAVDLRGRGESTPKVKDGIDFNMRDQIANDIPKVVSYISNLNDLPIFFVAHSWGGVMINATLIRNPDIIKLTKGVVYFASRRRITIVNFDQFLKIGLLWNFGSRLLIGIYGYLPGVKLKIGSDDEPRSLVLDTIKWVRSKKWIDSDGFDYHAQKEVLPPVLQLVGIDDHAFGHPKHIEMFMNDFNAQEKSTVYLSKSAGNSHDYNHISILTHPDAKKDHFQFVLEFIKRYLD